MIHIEGLGKRYGERILFDDVSWHVKKRDRIGLSGPNGFGKTTLLRMLAGFEEPDAGQIRMASDTTIGYLPQDGIAHRGRTLHDEVSLAFEELLALEAEQKQIEERLADTSHDDGGDHDTLLERYADVQERFNQLGGWEIEGQIADVLRGLGFAPEDGERNTEEFSGGWQMRIALARLLLARPNLLLMDEPTNHLDLPARNWLEEYLAEYPGAVVLVSHDRYFLDATVKRITEVGLKTLTDYHGNYSHYTKEHAARMERLLSAHQRQKEEIEKAEAFISRFRYKATKARQVQSRIKMLEKTERIEIPPERKKIRFRFPAAPRPGRVVLELKDASKSYGGKPVLRGVTLPLERGDRVALVGPNGAGKTTLMRMLAGDLEPDTGERILGHRVVMDYFAQNQAEALTQHHTVYEEMASSSPSAMVPQVRNILGGFLFSGDDVGKHVRVLSGGERNRLALAKMLLNPSNLLLLDEPTNHLDLDSKKVLLDALADYEGTLVFVSHDRYFVDRLATQVVDVGGGQAQLYPGGYEDFLGWSKRRETGEATSLPPAAPRPPRAMPDAELTEGRAAGSKGKKKRAAAAPPPSVPLPDPMAPRLRKKGTPPERQVREREARKARARIADLEKRIATSEAQVRELEAQMSRPGFYDDRERAGRATTEHRSATEEAAHLMREWEALQELVEST